MPGILFVSVKNREVFAAGSRDGFTPVTKRIHGIRGRTVPVELN